MKRQKASEKKKTKKKQFWLTYGESDGWLVFNNERDARADYNSISGSYENAKLLKVKIFEEIESEE